MLHRLAIISTVIWAALCLLVLFWCYKSTSLFDAKTEDIYYTYREGRTILQGENPYVRIHNSDMSRNDKYATYLPGGYLLSAAAQAAGLEKFSRWLKQWRRAMFVLHIATATLLFLLLYRERRSLAVAALATTIFLFNRWSLYVLTVAHLDTLVLFLFMLGVYLMRNRAWLGWISIGASLAIKQMAVFAIPILLIHYTMNAPAGKRTRSFLTALALLCLLPLIVSAPFLVHDASALIKSVLFSVTRHPSAHLPTYTLMELFGCTNAAARIPMLVVFVAIYLLTYTQRLPLYPALALQFLTFLYFNPVLFNQYLLWAVPFVLLCICSICTDVFTSADQKTV